MSVQETETKPKHRGYLEFGPLLLFFATNYFTKDIMLATAVLVGLEEHRTLDRIEGYTGGI